MKVTTIQFGDPEFSVESVLGPKTLAALGSANVASVFLIKQRALGDLSSATILASCERIADTDLRLLQSLVFDPLAYYCGNPIFFRLPGMQNFAIRADGDRGSVDIMIDLLNPSWGFYCDGERYQKWCWAGEALIDIAQRAFPLIASKTKGCVWRNGIVEKIKKGIAIDVG